jgi:immune inhibitor A
MKKIITLALICAISTVTWAMPARRTSLTMTQPDGSQITVFQHGDEHFHWLTNDKGEWITLGEDG